MSNEPIAECKKGHDLTEGDVATGKCPVCGENLFPGKKRLPARAPAGER